MNLVNQLPGMLTSEGEGDGVGGAVEQSTTPQSGLTGTFSELT